MQKWLMFHTMKKIIEARNDKKSLLDAEALERIGKFMSETHLILSDKTGRPPPIILRSETLDKI